MKSPKTFGDYYLLTIGATIALVFGLFILGKIGLIEEPFTPPVQVEVPKARAFDRKECVSRKAYEIRDADPTISDEMLSGDVARACAIEESEIRGW